MSTYDAKCTSRSGVTVAQATLEIPQGQDAADYVRAWAAKAGAFGWSMIGPLGTADQAFRSGLVK